MDSISIFILPDYTIDKILCVLLSNLKHNSYDYKFCIMLKKIIKKVVLRNKGVISLNFIDQRVISDLMLEHFYELLERDNTGLELLHAFVVNKFFRMRENKSTFN